MVHLHERRGEIHRHGRRHLAAAPWRDHEHRTGPVRQAPVAGQPEGDRAVLLGGPAVGEQRRGPPAARQGAQHGRAQGPYDVPLGTCHGVEDEPDPRGEQAQQQSCCRSEPQQHGQAGPGGRRRREGRAHDGARGGVQGVQVRDLAVEHGELGVDGVAAAALAEQRPALVPGTGLSIFSTCRLRLLLPGVEEGAGEGVRPFGRGAGRVRGVDEAEDQRVGRVGDLQARLELRVGPSAVHAGGRALRDLAARRRLTLRLDADARVRRLAARGEGIDGGLAQRHLAGRREELRPSTPSQPPPSSPTSSPISTSFR